MNELVKGVMTVILLSLALGQYPKLERWDCHHAAEALTWRRPLPYFFAPAPRFKSPKRGKRTTGNRPLFISYC